MNQSALQRGFELYQAGQLEPAAELLQQHLRALPDDAAANHLLGGIYYRQGRFAGARDHFARACAAPGATAEMFNNLGAALNALGDDAGAIAAYQRALALDPDYAHALSNLAVIFRVRGESERAIDSLRRAVAIDPELREASANLRNAYRDVVSPWHFAMINDRPRNEAFRRAIAAAAPGRRVLDIGTGTGLLAMLAVRAGAAEVTACESVPVIAAHAREIVARNGLGRSVHVVPKHSTDLVTGRDLAQRAQVLVTETFSSDLLSEGVLAAVEHAHRELLTGDAIIIPSRAAAVAYLAGGPEIENMLFAAEIEGFDLSPFNDFAPPLLAVALNDVPHEVLSDDFELFGFDLRAQSFPAERRIIAVPVTRDGMACALVQWIRLDFGDLPHYENRPVARQGESHWTQILHRFPRPFPVSAGAVVNVVVRHDRQHISVDPPAAG